jgi:cyclic 2,3-diphosphoglycerate synthetase
MRSNGLLGNGSSPVAALLLIDGADYPATARDALVQLPYDVVGRVRIDGGGENHGARSEVPLYDSFETALSISGAKVVIDLSDAPVGGTRGRLWFASRALAAGLAYVGPDFSFQPADFAAFDLPSLAVVGAGKRVGKTAVSGYLARLLSRSGEVVLVTMGRGGPAEPVVIEKTPTIEDLLALSRSGLHAASDYLENAVFSRVVTVGCRRWGGGIAGLPFFSNVTLGARIAASRGPDFVIFEGSGGVIPPIAVGARVVVAAANQDCDAVAGGFGAYRLLLSKLVILTMCEEPLASAADVQKLRSAIKEVSSELPVIAAVLRPSPARPIAGRRVAFFSTAPSAIHSRLREHLTREHGAQVLLLSGNLARRGELRADLDSPPARAADLYLVEIKAAAIEVVAETAAERGVEVVFTDNTVVPLAGEPSIDDHLLALAKAAGEKPIA